MIEKKRYYNVTEAAEILGVSVESLLLIPGDAPIVTHRQGMRMYRHKYLMKFKAQRESVLPELPQAPIRPAVTANVNRGLPKPKPKPKEKIEPTRAPEVIPKKRGRKRKGDESAGKQ